MADIQSRPADTPPNTPPNVQGRPADSIQGHLKINLQDRGVAVQCHPLQDGPASVQDLPETNPYDGLANIHDFPRTRIDGGSGRAQNLLRISLYDGSASVQNIPRTTLYDGPTIQDRPSISRQVGPADRSQAPHADTTNGTPQGDQEDPDEITPIPEPPRPVDTFGKVETLLNVPVVTIGDLGKLNTDELDCFMRFFVRDYYSCVSIEQQEAGAIQLLPEKLRSKKCETRFRDKVRRFLNFLPGTGFCRYHILASNKLTKILFTKVVCEIDHPTRAVRLDNSYDARFSVLKAVFNPAYACGHNFRGDPLYVENDCIGCCVSMIFSEKKYLETLIINAYTAEPVNHNWVRVLLQALFLYGEVNPEETRVRQLVVMRTARLATEGLLAALKIYDETNGVMPMY